MKRVSRPLLFVALPAVLAALGYFAGPGLARANRDVALADRVASEQAGEVEGRTDASKAFHLSGRTTVDLYEGAAALEQRFRIGTALLGIWCGLVICLKAVGAVRRSRRIEFEVDQGNCLSCARCYKYCPRERLRWADAPGKAPQNSGDSR